MHAKCTKCMFAEYGKHELLSKTIREKARGSPMQIDIRAFKKKMSCKTLEGRELPTGPNSDNQIGYKTCEMISPNNGPPRNDSSLFHTIHSSFTSFELDFLILFAIRPQGVVLASTVSMQVN